jgi:hypothetical protein
MNAARMRLLLAGLLFFGWMGWLAYLAFSAVMTPRIILSRPQFLISNLDVIAEVHELPADKTKAAPVKVIEVYWPPEQKKALEGKTIEVKGLADCRKDWTGPGKYILPLVHSEKEGYMIAAIPHSPGFPPPPDPGQPDQPRIYRVYPVTPETLEQLKSIPKLPR